ncbi:MAG TPA: ATP-binding protein, partial [Actinomycetota bacterium]|nr:ATP-binding protein [Actinomycetota bacterium]
NRAVLVFDLILCAWLLVASGLVLGEGGILAGRPSFSTGYPISAALLWGATGGPWYGVGAGAALAVAQLLTRPINGVSFGELTSGQVQNVIGSCVNYIVAGVAIGLVSRVLVRSAEEVQAANAELVRERERAARLAERESMARQIHDSVLQALAFVHKRGSELSRQPQIESSEVAQLAAMAEQQEGELRALIARDPQEIPRGQASLRELLEAGVRSVEGVETSMSAVGPIWIERSAAEELAAAVRQALENVVEHAGAGRVAVFAEQADGRVIVSVRDDGKGFSYDEAALRAADKVGILKSMKGRVESIGGAMEITTAAGRGTEIEFSVPFEAST